MPNKVESAIKKMLGKNEKALEKGKKKKSLLVEGPAKAVTDSMVTDEEAFMNEMKRRKTFGNMGGGAKTLPRKPAPKKKGTK